MSLKNILDGTYKIGSSIIEFKPTFTNCTPIQEYFCKAYVNGNVCTLQLNFYVDIQNDGPINFTIPQSLQSNALFTYYDFDMTRYTTDDGYYGGYIGELIINGTNCSIRTIQQGIVNKDPIDFTAPARVGIRDFVACFTYAIV